jgi:alkylhydroperoxidase family enzyme
VLEDLETAPLSDAERALFRFVEKVNRESEHIQPEDVERVKAQGWSDEALYDAITVCALFNFYNRWADATGVREHPPELYARSGERIAQSGYGGPAQPPKSSR